MPHDLAQLTADLLAAARRAGADAADAMAMTSAFVSIDARARALEQAERAESTEYGLRVLVGRRQACVSASDMTPATLAEVADRAVAMARLAPEDRHIGLADPDRLARDWDLAALDLDDPAPPPAPEALQDAALAAEAAALDHPEISQVSQASAAHGRREVHIAATNGFAGGYARTDHSLSCVAITGEGTKMERDYCGESRLHHADLPTPGWVGRRAADRAVARANPRRPKTGAYPVLFDERIAGSLIGHLLSAINGQAIARGASWARDLLGRQVLPDALSLTEDPLRPRASSSRPFDAEGLAARPRTIVDGGRLTGWTLDLGTGRKLGMDSTASASRALASPPSPSVGNVTLSEGAASRDDLIAAMGTGLLVTSMIGSTINPNTGDYSRGASGLWIENGEIAHAVSEVTIAGNLRDMLRNLVPASDARPHLSRRVPSLLVAGLTLAGD